MGGHKPRASPNLTPNSHAFRNKGPQIYGMTLAFFSLIFCRPNYPYLVSLQYHDRVRVKFDKARR
jgi:hypothetical protein